MKRLKAKSKVYFSGSVIIFFLFFSGQAGAEMQSPNFQIKSDVIGSFGADSSSPNSQLNDTGGEAETGIVSGSGKDLWSGFWNYLLGKKNSGNAESDDSSDHDSGSSDSNQTNQIISMSGTNATPSPPENNPDQGSLNNSGNNIPATIPPADSQAARPKSGGLISRLLESLDWNWRQGVAAAQKVGEKVEKNKKLATTTAATVAAVSILPVVLEASSIKDLLLITTNSFGSLFGLIFRRRRDWGIVYDVNTGKPVPLVSINILNDLGRSLDQKITDKLGAYIFLVTQGRYVLEIEKQGYQLADKDSQFKTFYSDNYYGGELDISSPDSININIPLRSLIDQKKRGDVKGKISAWRNFATRLIFSFISVLFYAGFALSIISLFIVLNKKMAIAMVLAYVFGAILRNFALKERGWGEVFGLAGEISPFATVRAFDKNSGEFAARTISDELGRYSLILRKGEYKLSVVSVRGEKWEGDVRVNRTRVVKKKIKLENNPDLFNRNKE